jgi:hypothetical protein
VGVRRHALIVTLLAAASRGEDPAPPTEKIVHAIDAGVAWLKARQGSDGSYGPCVGGPVGYDGRAVKDRECYRLGPTAFALFTLAVCEVPKSDPVIERGLEWLRKTPKRDYRYTSYESSAVILMLNAVNGTPVPPNPKSCLRSTTARPPPASRFTQAEWRWMDERVRHLIGREPCFRPEGGFGYSERDRDYADVSATQFAILALRLASFAGYPVEKVRPGVWRDTAKYLRAIAAGGFPYHSGSDPSRGMTAAALSTLLICREQLTITNTKEPPWLGALVGDGLAYLDENFDVAANPSPHFYDGHDHYHYCHLYAIERAGVLSRRRDFRGRPWYPAGAAWLLDKQGGSGGLDRRDFDGAEGHACHLLRAALPEARHDARRDAGLRRLSVACRPRRLPPSGQTPRPGAGLPPGGPAPRVRGPYALPAYSSTPPQAQTRLRSP